MTDERDKLLDHEYDGIREMDNNLPMWWLGLFYFTIAFGVVYMLYFHIFHIGYSSADAYRAEVDPTFVRVGAAEERTLGVLPEYHSPFHRVREDVTPYSRLSSGGGPEEFVVLTAATDTTTYTALTEPADLKAGRQTFTKNCASCHGKLGEGGIGPNLTDQYWLHTPGISGIVKSVTYGYPAQGMIPWRGTLKPDEILQVASHVLTLQGTNPPNAKEPQGELVSE